MAAPRRRRRTVEDPMTEIARIGRSIAVRRIELGITQQALADLAGTSRSTVQALEHGAGTVKLSLFVDIAEVLGLRVTARAATDHEAS